MTKKQPVLHHRLRPSMAWAALSVLLVFLASCGGGSPSSSALPTPTFPLIPTVTPQPSTTGDTGASGSSDWTMYHRDTQRTGYTATTPDPQRLTKAWSKKLDGAVYAEPLVVGNRVIVATEGDSLYSLDPATGNVQWHTNVGSPVPGSALPCGDINPLGITGTPVYDPTTGLVYAVAEVSGPAHILVGVDVTTGQVKMRRSADTDGMDPRAHQQRGALALANGRVYITYGGLDGDCSDYIGRVVAAQTDGQGPLLVYRVPTPREGGIWATPGPVIDTAGNVYVSVGNGEVTQGDWDHSDSVLKLSPTLHLEDAFAPTNWADENAGDADLGSQGVVLLPGDFIFIAGKGGKGYTLHANALGGVGGQIDAQNVCVSFGGAAVVGSTMVLPCVDGLRQVSVDASGRIHQGWHASGSITGSPIVGGHTVYSLSNEMVYALNISNGKVVTSLNIGQANRFATPTIAGNRLFLGTLEGITAVNI